ncbi:MAG: 23S rRNA (pseudouridine(1915)-N(3))-methyltransferase RlmH [Proteobacteria bacterium]|nr:23S rRNA (pseudouridine(1915)-N(3))-methyltransferase RlmH [Pseudomonadota bacterium]
MHISVVAVGRLKSGPETALAQQFLVRLTWPVTIREVEEKKKLPPAALRKREGELLLAACPKFAPLIALDEQGTGLSSRDFAERLGRWRDEGEAEIAFIIGGAGGLDKAILERASLVLSLGPMTWPHQLARGLLLEQLYRGQQILAGHPYHRD